MYPIIKTAFDKVFALLLLLLVWPLMLVVAVLVCIFVSKWCIFRQERVGRNEAIFTVYKFRTMNDKCDEKGILLDDDKRLGNFGKALRRTSLDELPQLFNILKGDMSFIGPRPLLVEYLPLYSSTQKRRHEVTPGITGLAQVNGRNAISWKKRLALDVEYVDEMSLGLDLKIAFLTVRKVFQQEGISQEGQATMRKFTGQDDA